MGEYARINGQVVKLGTLEDLMLVTHSELVQARKAGAIEAVDGNASVDEYLDPAKGYRFRFPFTDELGRRGDLAHRISTRVERDLEIELVGMEDGKTYRGMMAHQKISARTRGADGWDYTLLDMPCPLSDTPGRPRLTHLGMGTRYTPKLLVCGEKPMPDGTIQTLFKCPVCGAMFRLSADEAKLVRSCVKLLIQKEFGEGADEPSLIPTKRFARYADLVYLSKNLRGDGEET